MLTPSVSRARVRAAAAGAAAAALLATVAAGARADTITSDNWAGYAAHTSHVHFKKVTATWVQPKATCTRGEITYSSFWDGLGGYSVNSAAMEQMGTEVDCNADGTESLSAW